ncbi:MAG TPA: hypothetical protein VF857_05535 [Spirochaetota bacterium]
MKIQKTILIASALGVFIFSGCGDTPIFDMLANANFKVVLKGTYESNAPRSWIPYAADGSMNDDAVSLIPGNFALQANSDSSSNHYLNPSVYNSLPSNFYLDIAEMTIDGEKFAPFRRVYRSSVSDADPFFDGTGFEYKNDNVVSGRSYDTLQIYVRKMIFDNAQSFNATTGIFEKDLQSLFDESTINGYDINPDQSLAIYDTLRKEKDTTNRIFPLEVPISGGLVFDGKKDYIIETRMVVKNFLRRYEKLYIVGSAYSSHHFWGLSDWSHEVRANDVYIGGNVLSVARAYTPGETADIIGSVPGPDTYVIAIPSTDEIASYKLDSLIVRPDDNYYALAPVAAGTDIASNLEYFVSNQKYMDFYASYVMNVNKADDLGLLSYHDVWTVHETSRESLKIPLLATWSTGGRYTLTNVSPGTYKIYYSNLPVSAGSLPVSFATSSSGPDVVVLASDAGSTVTKNLLP